MAKAGDRTLEETPTWAVASVCAVFVIISVIIEHGIHSLGKWFQKKQNKAMSEALEKIKAELMLVGFISLLLTVGTEPITKICISPKVGDTMLPCKKQHNKEDHNKGSDNDSKRKLLWLAQDMVWRRSLAAEDDKDYCAARNKVSLISYTALHQVHIFIFILALVHVFYSVTLMLLGRAKMNRLKAWELETTSLEYQYTNDPSRFRFAHQTSFVKRHSGISRIPGLKWIVAFFRQFFGSISKVDYLTMRRGFINAHFAPNSKFDFHKYINRSMEDDFKVVVGISMSLWFFAFILLLLNVHDLYILSWISFVPLIILVMLGTKLEVVIMEMAQEIQDRTTVIKGAPIVKPSNELFWFNRPKWILYLIHFTLFENAFQMSYFLWISFSFGLKSCFHKNLALILTRVVIGIIIQLLCSYITFPLYCLVTQMGSHMKQTIFDEQTAKALMKWQKTAQEKNKLRKAGAAEASSGFVSAENTPSIGSSPMHLLHKSKSNTIDVESVRGSPRSYHSDTDMSDTPSPRHVSLNFHEASRHGNHSREGDSGDFSFA